MLPRLSGALSGGRRVAGFLLALIGLPAVAATLFLSLGGDALPTDVLILQLFIVVVALVGGIWPALTAAVLAGLLLNFFFIEPLFTVGIRDPFNVLAVVVFLVVATLVSVVVDQAARQYRAARRSAAESETLVDLAGSVLAGGDALGSLVGRVREVFGQAGVLLRDRGAVLHSAADAALVRETDVETTIPVGDRATLELRGRRLGASDQRVLGAVVAQLEATLVQRDLAAETERMRPIEQTDRVRSALLAAVGHDLRRPLAAATAAVSSLGSERIVWSDNDRMTLLATAHEALMSLDTLVTDLLDASRLQAGALAVAVEPTAIEEVVALALDELGAGPGDVVLHLPARLPQVLADPALLRRVLVNLLSNALRFSAEVAPPSLSADVTGETVGIRVTDTGPGIPEDRRDIVFVPFHRVGDTDARTGVGLGLALSKGFVEGMGGTIEPTETPGGGLTMVVALPLAPAEDEVAR